MDCDKLKGLEDIQMNFENKNTKNSFWMPTILFGDSWKIDRDSLVDQMIKAGIEVRPFFYPVSSFPKYKNNYKNKVGYAIFNRGINLLKDGWITAELS